MWNGRFLLAFLIEGVKAQLLKHYFDRVNH
jgi:hypothetical protein